MLSKKKRDFHSLKIFLNIFKNKRNSYWLEGRRRSLKEEELVGELKPRSGTFLSRAMTPRVCSRSVSSSEVFWSVMRRKSKTRNQTCCPYSTLHTSLLCYRFILPGTFDETFTYQQLRKKGLFYFQKLSSVPVTQLRRKSLQVLRFSHELIRLFIKKLKKFHKKIFFSILLLAIILLPLKYQF